MKYEGKLSKFLKKHRCYNEFKASIREKYNQSLEEYCDMTDVGRYIISGIDWDSSRKGLDFWAGLHKMWKNNG